MFSFKHRWIADLLVLSLIVYFGVNAFMAVLGSKLAPIPVKDQSTIQPSKGLAAEVRPLEDYAVISERSLFGGSKKASTAPSPEPDSSSVSCAQKLCLFSMIWRG